MTGTQSHEGIAGTAAAVEYLADLGWAVEPQNADRRDSLEAAFRAIGHYERKLIARLLEGLAELPDGAPLVLVVHHPPYDTAVDNSSTKGHVGSRSVRSFIETHRPLVCLSGHIHEAVGTGAIGPTRLINPGPVREGQYAYIELAPDATLAACELRTA